MRICDNMLIVCTYEELGNMYRHVMKENNQIIDLEVMDNRYGKDMEKVLGSVPFAEFITRLKILRAPSALRSGRR